MSPTFLQTLRLWRIDFGSGIVSEKCGGNRGSHRSFHDLDSAGRCAHQLLSDPLRRWFGETKGPSGRRRIDECERRNFCLEWQLLGSAGREHIWRNQPKVNMLTICAVDVHTD